MTTLTTTFPTPLSPDQGPGSAPRAKQSRKTATITSIHALRATMPETGVRGLLLGGFLVLAVGFGGMSGWAAMAPLHSAISAAGSLAPETGRKVVKNTEGGVISEILVREGDRVVAGQPLMRLDPTEAQTRLDLLNASLLDSRAMEARLQAELFEKPEIEWPAQLADRRASEPAIDNAMRNQEKLFQVRRNQLETEAKLTQDRIATLNDEAKSLEQQRSFLAREIKLSDEDIQITQGLLDRGNSTRTRLVAAQKENAQLHAQDHELEARMSQSRQQAVDAQGDLVRRRSDFREKVLVDLEKARGDVQKMADQMRDAKNRLDNRTIKAPDAGDVVMYGHPAVGGSITANEPVLDIVPDDKALLAEVRIQPKDIKSMAPGLPVKVQLTAYDTRVVGTIDGTVSYVSADRLTDNATRQEYYLARIRLKDADSHEVGKLHIKAGMPVEARIVLSARTPLDYLIQPLRQSYVKAFIQE
ncbi:HlyD family type I secretion periplasmic adaptor subunit [Azospirillum picis]|uniref:Membrane fusion protein (MFP) family protein n=1 Tax=Azospirillum picis TaxID=488438 RepID=A0ABU0MTS5_9PROT|nr:HlyD family type I secretion periplasmic adaptor subunit [Azospirillum picis]MBP2302967.1 HlyD family type I secretion membrane fusion protein [Azospirillum picis]MDQ0536719.1 HlyD family type I secretion membrane fusion protein [Azospirillum picis]